jgi:hypothetical protein
MNANRDLRKEYENGTLSVSEWNKVIDDFLEEDKEKRAGQVGPVPAFWENTYTFPVVEHFITADYIKRYAYAIGGPNPFYYDEAYANRSMHGGIIAPSLF